MGGWPQATPDDESVSHSPKTEMGHVRRQGEGEGGNFVVVVASSILVPRDARKTANARDEMQDQRSLSYADGPVSIIVGPVCWTSDLVHYLMYYCMSGNLGEARFSLSPSITNHGKIVERHREGIAS